MKIPHEGAARGVAGEREKLAMFEPLKRQGGFSLASGSIRDR